MNLLARSFTKALDKRDVDESDNLDEEEEDGNEDEDEDVIVEVEVNEADLLDLELTTCKFKYAPSSPLPNKSFAWPFPLRYGPTLSEVTTELTKPNVKGLLSKYHPLAPLVQTLPKKIDSLKVLN